jgi:isoleucyl-tRNA synthetase
MCAEKNKYSETLNLPQTAFPMRAGLPKNEPVWVEKWLKEDIYGQLRARREAAGAPKFILHLGPPYANGHMHLGHALTYVLKDFIVRTKFMAGFDSPYVPGWDCHGLPIEWKVEQDIRAEGKTKYDYTTKEIRDRCRAYANKWIGIQKGEWQRFGVLADWERPYKTMDYANEAGIVQELGKMVRRGLVYKGLRSTLWSTEEETALAEAEVEYDDNHESKCVYVAFPVVGRANEYVVIWTTTPWTLPANRAVAYGEDIQYQKFEAEGKQYWVATDLGEALLNKAWQQAERGEVVQGRAFEGWQLQHPFYPDRVVPMLPGDHVTTEQGTGFVHIAPAHGQEDFQLGKETGLDLHCPVQGNGTYDETVGPALAGKDIWSAQEDIIEIMRANGSLLATHPLTHSYPISWRSKKPLIFRATSQWFVDLDKERIPETGASLRQSSLDFIHGTHGRRAVSWVPAYGEQRIGSMIANRPDWCLSRQRAWGVPITICVHKKTGEMVTDEAVWNHLAGLVEKEGVDAWNSRLEKGKQVELFPAGWLADKGLSVDDFEYVTDILDVWFDSGTTHAHVLRAQSSEGQRFSRADGKRPADLYQEGSDQHRGWFHSSLLTSVANYGDAPYEAVVTSGFVVDGQGRKFSKSLGNGVEPRELLGTYGMDIVRLWAASSDYSEDIRYSDEIMKASAEAYRRFRNTFRFLLGNVSDFEETHGVPAADMPELEQYMLHRLAAVLADVRQAYDTYKFHRGYRALYDFCNADLSNFYFDVRKDALYCDGKNAPRRRACQTVLLAILRGLTTHLAPIMPFTTDEAHRARFGEAHSVHLEAFALPEEGQIDGEKWDAVMETRDAVNRAVEEIRAAGQVGANVEVAVTLPDLHGLAEHIWVEVLAVSSVKAGDGLAVAKAGGYKCPRCWTYHKELTGDVCSRCADALKQDGHKGVA